MLEPYIIIKRHYNYNREHCGLGLFRVPTAQRIQGIGPKKIPVRENTGNLEILPKHRENTGNLVWSSGKFPDSKGKIYFEICHENLQKIFEVCQVSFVYVIVT